MKDRLLEPQKDWLSSKLLNSEKIKSCFEILGKNKRIIDVFP